MRYELYNPVHNVDNITASLKACDSLHEQIAFFWCICYFSSSRDLFYM